MRNQNMDPREITLKFNSKCAETGKPLKKGDKAIYYPNGKKVFSPDSKQAEEFRNWQFDMKCLGQNY